MIDAYPTALKIKDVNGKLPLRILYELSALDTLIDYVRNAYPEAQKHMFDSDEGRSPDQVDVEIMPQNK